MISQPTSIGKMGRLQIIVIVDLPYKVNFGETRTKTVLFKRRLSGL
jgi:hypothetical protein